MALYPELVRWCGHRGWAELCNVGGVHDSGPEVSTEQELRKLPVPTQTDSSGSGIPAAVLPPPTIARVSRPDTTTKVTKHHNNKSVSGSVSVFDNNRI